MSKLIDKSRIDIRISYGLHATVTQARPVRDYVKSFRPHVYVMENANFLMGTKNWVMPQINADLVSARKERVERKRLLNYFKPGLRRYDFKFAEFEIIIDNPGTILYFVEEYSKAELKSINHAGNRYLDLDRPILNLIYQNRIDEALLLAEDIIRQYILTVRLFRNRRMAEGFEAMRSDLPAMFPRVEKLKLLRVFARFGTFHSGLTEILKSKDFMVSEYNVDLVVGHFSRMSDFSRKLSADPNACLNDGERAELLFDWLYAGPGGSGSSVEEAVLQKTKFEAMGADGFVRLLKALPRPHRTGLLSFFNRKAPKDFVDFAYKLINA